MPANKQEINENKELTGPLDLPNGRPVIAQQLSAVGSGENAREIEDFESVEHRNRHGFPPVWTGIAKRLKGERDNRRTPKKAGDFGREAAVFSPNSTEKVLDFLPKFVVQKRLRLTFGLWPIGDPRTWITGKIRYIRVLPITFSRFT